MSLIGDAVDLGGVTAGGKKATAEAHNGKKRKRNTTPFFMSLPASPPRRSFPPLQSSPHP